MTEPTNDQIQAVAHIIYDEDGAYCGDCAYDGSAECADCIVNGYARALLTSTDPEMWAALAAHIPLDALAQAGRLTEEQCCDRFREERADGDYKVYTCADAGEPCQRRYVSPWEVATDA